MSGIDYLYKKYKLVYLDTNVISNICKKGDLKHKFLAEFPINENYCLCFSTYTLYEISKSKTLYKDFKSFYSIYPSLLVVSYFPLAIKEIELIAGDVSFVNPILLSPQGIRIEDKLASPNSLDKLLELPEIIEAFANVDQYTSNFYNEVISILDKDEFKYIDKDRIKKKKGEFVRTYIKYELKYRFFNGKNVIVDKKKIKQMKSLDVLAHAIFYKFFSDETRKKQQSDIIDILIMTTTPYVDTFVSEKNAIDILKKIKNQTSAIINLKIRTLSEIENNNKA